MTSDNEILIRLEDLYFSYSSDPPILKGVTFELRDRQRVGLIGPNGSGKTTLFHVITGLLKSSSGRIEIFGKTMEKERHFAGVRQKIGLLFQDSDDQLFSPTVLEDVAFGPLNQGKTVAEAIENSRQVLDMLGLSKLENKITYKLSGGEKRLVSLATVLSMQPRVLLLDEPTTGLDNASADRMVEILNQLNMACISISHDMDFITQVTDNVYGMLRGQIVLEKAVIPHTHVHAHGFGRIPHNHSNTNKLKPTSKTEP